MLPITPSKQSYLNSQHSYYGKAGPNLQFSGLGDSASRLIGYIDARELIQLATLDLLGMTVFRTVGEIIGRPPGTKMDGARETFIRENMGMACNVFVAGLISQFMLKSLGKSVNGYNPRGIPAHSWIHAQRLEIFRDLYGKLLNGPIQNPMEARKELIHQVLSRMVSSNTDLHLLGKIKAGEILPPQARVDNLRQQVKELLNEETATNLLESTQHLPLAAQAEELGKELLAEADGRLTPKALDKLKAHFDLKVPGGGESAAGTHRFNERAMALVEESKQRLLEEEARQGRPIETALKHFDARKEFDQARLTLTLQDFAGGEKLFVKRASHIARDGGLVETVNLLGTDGKVVAKNIKRDIVLQELKHFLEQYVDRAEQGINGKTAGWQQRMWRALTGESRKKGLWRRWLPQLDEGLVTSALKTKSAYTWIPIWTTILVGMSVGFFNNWYTRRKHGGISRFPGDGPLRQTAGRPQTNMRGNLSGGSFPIAPAVTRRANGAFGQFQRAHQGQGGRLA